MLESLLLNLSKKFFIDTKSYHLLGRNLWSLRIVLGTVFSLNLAITCLTEKNAMLLKGSVL